MRTFRGGAARNRHYMNGSVRQQSRRVGGRCTYAGHTSVPDGGGGCQFKAAADTHLYEWGTGSREVPTPFYSNEYCNHLYFASDLDLDLQFCSFPPSHHQLKESLISDQNYIEQGSFLWMPQIDFWAEIVLLALCDSGCNACLPNSHLPRFLFLYLCRIVFIILIIFWPHC